MANLKRLHLSTLVILALFGFLLGLSVATITSLIVKVGEEVTHPINLTVEDRVLIQYKVLGLNVSALQFSISFPNATVRDFGGSGDFSYSFICDVEGEYMLHFVNTDQKEDMRVTLNYEVQHYIFGIPQLVFATILVALICVFGVVVAFALMGRSYN
ncbi:MAG: hypothetical protein NWE80_04335 [Candidatus Bathyarchaeota archaeon]|nr:hypothetical protein [Candidatus Bathyarchaeota archaeon]